MTNPITHQMHDMATGHATCALGARSSFGSVHQDYSAPTGTAFGWLDADPSATSTDPVTKPTRRARSSSP